MIQHRSRKIRNVFKTMKMWRYMLADTNRQYPLSELIEVVNICPHVAIRFLDRAEDLDFVIGFWDGEDRCYAMTEAGKKVLV